MEIQRIQDRNLSSTGQALQIGFNRSTAASLTDGVWNDVFGIDGAKRIWSLKLQSPHAVGIRVHFRRLLLPAGVTLRMFTPEHQQYAFELRADPRISEDYWSAAVFGEVVQFEVIDNRPDAIIAEQPVIEIDSIGHWFDGNFGSSAACELDYMCYPAWDPTGSSVGRMTFVDQGANYACSGAVLANATGDFSPYFLTALHCINNSAAASSAIVYWLDQNLQCNGDPAQIWMLKSSRGSQLLSMSTSSDQSLLLLSDDIPAEVAFAGWTTSAQANGTQVTAIHHPHADPKKLSTGALGDETVFDSIRYLPVTFNAGVTEPGSSGSPLFNSGHLLIGTDSLGSFKSCTNRGGPAYFGSFRQGFDSLNDTGNFDYLTGGYYGVDKFSPNQTQATAAPIAAPMGLTTLNVSNLRPDWFKVTVPAHSGISVLSRDLAATQSYIALQILAAPNTRIGSFSLSTDTSGITSPYVLWNSSSTDATYYLSVYSSGQKPLNYQLGIGLRTSGAPDVVTGPASFYIGGGVDLTGTVGNNGQQPTTFHFEYSFSDHPDSPTISPEESTSIPIHLYVPSFPLNSLMSYRLVATNPSGTTYGGLRYLLTPAYSFPVHFVSSTVYFNVTNPGSVALTNFPVVANSSVQVTSITLTGDPAFTSTGVTPCKVDLYPSPCGFLYFSPPAAGSYSGTLSISLQDGRSYVFTLRGFSDSSLLPPLTASSFPGTFQAPPNGTVSQTIKVSNSGNKAVTIFDIATPPYYSQTNDCPQSMPAGATCQITIFFHPSSDYQVDSNPPLVVYTNTQVPLVVSLVGQVVDTPVILDRKSRNP